ncbi:methionyl-tRNA synthetase [Bacillus sp. SORGH_AS 510]|uniref:methionine--tRNA ligase n=1 Tax=Bacillus sp. SORGH_AS_0510 TaxID=3041771 RepID=UPI00278A130C|nr:methionine--tRNA ligase [Bacillus sp. SORGH_AS_0510]MDQ1146009.1 methionyl-tRNA synthetase [Bacillus sp. SORGH_AS_0510]
MNVFIGGAWPYANGSLHLGHIASLLPGDILARYYRQKGDQVLYVSGSDCNGTPIAIRAKQEGVSPREIADRYHVEFENNFKRLGFSYNCYTRTDTEHHRKTVQEIFLELLENGYIYKKEVEQTFCETCDQFLPDRYVEGLCPNCGQSSRGDQCDYCSTILDPLDLLERKCKLCGNSPTVKRTEHFYFSLSLFQEQLQSVVSQAKANRAWRENAVHLTERYLNEGLLDRAVSRDIEWGISVPVEGFEAKKIYVWIEALSGYYSASKRWALETGEDESIFWAKDVTTYYVHGKDNIPFHSIIWPAILMGINSPALPDHIVSNEYLTLEKKKISTSRNWAVWVPDVLDKYHPDSIRYFLTINAPENRDTDFSWREFIYSHNAELLGGYGNLVNRTLKFIAKYYDGRVPQSFLDPTIEKKIRNIYGTVGQLTERSQFKQALEEIFDLVRFTNKYFDEQKPWKQVEEDTVGCDHTLFNCSLIIINLAQLLAPFLPFSSNQIKDLLGVEEFTWTFIESTPMTVKDVKPLFERIDIKTIEEELEKLNRQVK